MTSPSNGKVTDFAELVTVRVQGDTLAEVFCCSERTVRRLAKEAGMPKDARNLFGLTECMQWYVQHLITRAHGGDDDSITEERRQLVRAQRQRIELEIEKRRGELVEAGEVGLVINEMSTIFARHLESLSSRLANQLAGENNAATIAETITRETRAIRNAVSAAVVDFAATHHGSGDPGGAPGKKRGRVGRSKKNATARGAGTGALADESRALVDSDL